MTENLRPIKACHVCGRCYTISQWKMLHLSPIPIPPEGCECRNCTCTARLTLDLRGVESIADALPEEHTASRAEPPPEALDDDDPHHCPHSWGYRMEAATVFFAHVPLVPYPRPMAPKPNQKARRHDVLNELLVARGVLGGVLEMLIQMFAVKLADGDGEPTPEPKDAKP
jgi:hypothetical protein